MADAEAHRIQKFTPEGEFVSKFGEFGPDPGSLNGPSFLCVSPGGRIYVSDSMNNRIQVFRKSDLTEGVTKAVIVAGGGPYRGNNLWDATQMCANFAYRTLTYQGLTKETIYYLTSDTELDLDSNGVPDDVDGDATSTNLQYAITDWAVHEPAADSLVIYIVNHGGPNTFRMSDREILSASELDSWLDSLQEAISGKVIVIYDACKSGSFLASLTPPSDKLRERIVIASASHDEPAYFATQGSVSFSSYFWTHIFNGLDIKNAFSLAKNAMGSLTEFQHSLLDANGNGKGNEPEDEIMIQNICIGNGTLISGDAPVIGSVSPDQTISGTSDSLLYAADVSDDDGVVRVWTMIRPPDYIRGSSDNPVRELPSADLMPAEDKRYKNTYRDFNTEGTYQIAVYARDRAGNTSVPKLTTVSVENPSRRRAVIVAGGFRSDDLWPAVEKIAGLAYEALRFQGYSDDDIYFMSPVTFSEGVDGSATLGNLGNDALGIWAKEDTRDLVLYMVGNGDTGTFEISGTETLSAAVLDNWLDNLQDHIQGRVTVIYDACRSGSFLGPLTPPPGKERIFISSAGPDQPACFLSDGDISFSRFFWSHVLNGADVFKGFFEAMNVMLAFKNQLPLLNTDGNGIANEDADGVLARNYTIGAGIMLAGDDPLVGSVSPEQIIYGQTSSASLLAKDVTTTGGIKKIWAIITPPGSENPPGVAVTDLPDTELVYNPESGRYEGAYKGFSAYGQYDIVIYAKDTDGNISPPETSSVCRYADPISGDINGDGNTDLRDAIIALKSVAGTEVFADQIRADYAISGTDVNEDNKLGLEEVIHILQKQMQ